MRAEIDPNFVSQYYHPEAAADRFYRLGGGATIEVLCGDSVGILYLTIKSSWDLATGLEFT